MRGKIESSCGRFGWFLYEEVAESTKVYVAIIASLLLSLWVGKKPTKRTYEMFCLFFAGWASEPELLAHIEKLHRQEDNSS
jgi:hypothetical protein